MRHHQSLLRPLLFALLTGVDYGGRNSVKNVALLLRRRARFPSASCVSHAIPASEIYTTEYLFNHKILSRQSLD